MFLCFVNSLPFSLNLFIQLSYNRNFTLRCDFYRSLRIDVYKPLRSLGQKPGGCFAWDLGETHLECVHGSGQEAASSQWQTASKSQPPWEQNQRRRLTGAQLSAGTVALWLHGCEPTCAYGQHQPSDKPPQETQSALHSYKYSILEPPWKHTICISPKLPVD